MYGNLFSGLGVGFPPPPLILTYLGVCPRSSRVGLGGCLGVAKLPQVVWMGDPCLPVLLELSPAVHEGVLTGLNEHPLIDLPCERIPVETTLMENMSTFMALPWKRVGCLYKELPLSLARSWWTCHEYLVLRFWLVSQCTSWGLLGGCCCYCYCSCWSWPPSPRHHMSWSCSILRLLPPTQPLWTPSCVCLLSSDLVQLWTKTE